MDQYLHYALGTLLVQAQRLAELNAAANTRLLADIVFGLTLHSLLRCLLEASTPDQALADLAEQSALVMTPHLVSVGG